MFSITISGPSVSPTAALQKASIKMPKICLLLLLSLLSNFHHLASHRIEDGGTNTVADVINPLNNFEIILHLSLLDNPSQSATPEALTEHATYQVAHNGQPVQILTSNNTDPTYAAGRYGGNRERS